MHALPRRHRKGGGADEPAALGREPARRADPGHGRRLDLRPRAGGDEPGQAGAEALPRGFDMTPRLVSAFVGRVERSATRHPSGTAAGYASLTRPTHFTRI